MSPFTSIQVAVIPRNDPFVLSAVHPSVVDEIWPRASYSIYKGKYNLKEGSLVTYKDFGFQYL